MILDRNINFNIKDVSQDTQYLFPKTISPEKMAELVVLYKSAIKEIGTKLDIIDDEFQILSSHNPIHHIESRLKSPQSLLKKLKKRRCPLTIESIMQHITDMAGIRVICYYIDEVYVIAEMLSKQNDITILKTSDYIQNPKPSGYRSLHLIIAVPVFLANRKEIIPVEIQLRTIAMDFWASLEHHLGYKTKENVTNDLCIQLKNCAEEISSIDSKMQHIYNEIENNGVRAKGA